MAKREALTLKEADSSSSFPCSLWTNRRCCLCAYRNLARYSQICGESRHIQPLVYTALQGCDIAHTVSAALSYSHDQSASDSRDFETRNNVRGYCLLAPRLRCVPLPWFLTIIYPILEHAFERFWWEGVQDRWRTEIL